MMRTIHGAADAKGYEEGAPDRFFDGRDEWICVAVEGNSIVAFLSIEFHREGEEYIYLDDLWVTSQYRNNEIGTRLIFNAEEYAKEIGISTVCLHVEKSNTAAFRLYQRLGYRVFQDQENQYLMIKRISV